MEAGDQAIQIHTDRGTVNVSGVTPTEARQISLDASRVVVLPEARAVASAAAIQTIDERSDELTDKVLDRINETNPALFARSD